MALDIMQSILNSSWVGTLLGAISGSLCSAVVAIKISNKKAQSERENLILQLEQQRIAIIFEHQQKVKQIYNEREFTLKREIYIKFVKHLPSVTKEQFSVENIRLLADIFSEMILISPPQINTIVIELFKKISAVGLAQINNDETEIKNAEKEYSMIHTQLTSLIREDLLGYKNS